MPEIVKPRKETVSVLHVVIFPGTATRFVNVEIFTYAIDELHGMDIKQTTAAFSQSLPEAKSS